MRTPGLLLAGLLCAAVCAALVDAARAQSTSGTDGKDGKELIAVLDLEPVEASKAEAQALSDRLREVLLNTGHFQLADRSQMDAVLDEQALQQTGCTSQECAVQVGRVLGVRKLVVGKVVKVSAEVWLLSALMVDVETAETLRVASVRHRGDYFALMDERVREMGAKLAGQAAAAPTASAPAAPQGEVRKAAAALGVVPPPAAPKGNLVLAVFPAYVSKPVQSRAGQIYSDLRGDLSHREGVDYRYSAISGMADGTQVKLLDSIRGIEDDSWEGLFSTTPNLEYVRRTAASYDIDLVLMYKITGQRTSGDYAVYLIDVKRGQIFDEGSDWQFGSFHEGIRVGAKVLLDRFAAMH